MPAFVLAIFGFLFAGVLHVLALLGVATPLTHWLVIGLLALAGLLSIPIFLQLAVQQGRASSELDPGPSLKHAWQMVRAKPLAFRIASAAFVVYVVAGQVVLFVRHGEDAIHLLEDLTPLETAIASLMAMAILAFEGLVLAHEDDARSIGDAILSHVNRILGRTR